MQRKPLRITTTLVNSEQWRGNRVYHYILWNKTNNKATSKKWIPIFQLRLRFGKWQIENGDQSLFRLLKLLQLKHVDDTITYYGISLLYLHNIISLFSSSSSFLSFFSSSYYLYLPYHLHHLLISFYYYIIILLLFFCSFFSSFFLH